MVNESKLTGKVFVPPAAACASSLKFVVNAPMKSWLEKNNYKWNEDRNSSCSKF
jgi:hypothetical protein